MGQFGMGPFLYGSPLADLELAPLNPDLGQYFGASSGVLVTRSATSALMRESSISS